MQAQGRDDVTVCFFGEGATGTGVFGEALNIAALWSLPLIFICENNQYVELTPQHLHIAGEICDARRVLRDPGPARRRQRRRRGRRCRRQRRRAGARRRRPDADRGRHLSLVRPLRGGSRGLPRRGGGPRMARARPADPRPCRRRRRRRRDRRRGRGADRGRARVRPAEPADRARRPRHRPLRQLMTTATETRSLKFWQGINQALTEEMERDERVVLVGEDVARPGGPYGVTRGLLDKFGDVRVRDTPISEAVLVGLGVGGGAVGPAADRRDHVLRLRDDRDGPDRQPGREVPLLLRARRCRS